MPLESNVIWYHPVWTSVYSFLDTGSDKLWLYGKTLVAESINAVSHCTSSIQRDTSPLENFTPAQVPLISPKINTHNHHINISIFWWVLFDCLIVVYFFKKCMQSAVFCADILCLWVCCFLLDSEIRVRNCTSLRAAGQELPQRYSGECCEHCVGVLRVASIKSLTMSWL